MVKLRQSRWLWTNSAVRGYNWRFPGEIAVFFSLILLAAMANARQVPHTLPPEQGSGPDVMDPAIALLAEARRAFKNVQDYECTLVKRERVKGNLLPQQVMSMKVRNQPFSVYLRGESPTTVKGLEVCYVAGQNKGMMRVHLSGFLKILGFLSIEPLDPRVFKENRHAITEAGIAALLESISRYWELERRLYKTQVRITDDELAGSPCTRIETIHRDRDTRSFYAYRCVLCLDKATHLPVCVEAYDWPRKGGPADGELLESYSFLELRPNVGLGDGVFDH